MSLAWAAVSTAYAIVCSAKERLSFCTGAWFAPCGDKRKVRVGICRKPELSVGAGGFGGAFGTGAPATITLLEDCCCWGWGWGCAMATGGAGGGMDGWPGAPGFGGGGA